MKYGMFRVASAIPSVKVADARYNTEHILALVEKALKEKVELLVFPELSITSYSCQDLFLQHLLQEKAEEALQNIASHTKGLPITIVVGLPVSVRGAVYNCAAVINNGAIAGIVTKTHPYNSKGKSETKWFVSKVGLPDQPLHLAGQIVNISSKPQLFCINHNVTFGIEIGEDLWMSTPPSTLLCESGADVIVSLSAHSDMVGLNKYVHALLSQQSARTASAYVYSSCGHGESTQDVVYGGNALIYENSHLLAEARRYSLTPQMVCADIDIELLRHERCASHQPTDIAQTATKVLTVDIDAPIYKDSPLSDSELLRPISPLPFIPKKEEMDDTCEEILNIQALGLAQRLKHIGCKKVVIGISGGLDSTLALLAAVRTFDLLKLDRKGITGITMPGFGTSERTHDNATALMQALGVTIREISISKAVELHFEDIGHEKTDRNVTYENAQARERTQILMDVANDEGAIVIGTGDLSELALGWATYNGDHMSMYGINADIPKTLIRYIVRHIGRQYSQQRAKEAVSTAHDKVDISELLYDIVATPISPELLPEDTNTGKKQETEDIVGPYELHDFFLFYTVRYGFAPRKVFYLAKQAFGTRPTAPDNDEHAPVIGEETIRKWIKVFYRRFFNQQFKRSCLPDGPKVGSVGLSPRGDWQMPSDATARLWLDECEQL